MRKAMSNMRILITGSLGFIGRNFVVRLGEIGGFEISTFDRSDSPALLAERVSESDAVVHLAGENRPDSVEDFTHVNLGLTQQVCEAVVTAARKIPIIFTSSTQSELDNPYGVSKKAAELALEKFASSSNNPTVIYRLPGVFGKWCKPNYNSVVATFCHNIVHDLPIQINDPERALDLVYIDDVVACLLNSLLNISDGLSYHDVTPTYSLSLRELASQLVSFKECRESLVIPQVGVGLMRALYATYVSYLPVEKFSYDVVSHSDDRGTFVEMLKTRDSGQFSYFTAHPGITRGGHYHHTKTEKFLVIKGNAKYRFRNLAGGEVVEIESTGEDPVIVETIPGWTHDITNVGSDELVVMLWANEIFDREKPDTIICKV